MSQWEFVIAAYGVVGAVTIGLTAWSMLGMRRAEGDAEAVNRRQ